MDRVWAVYVFNYVTADYECVGVFTKEADARAELEQRRESWDPPARPARPRDHFAGICLARTWSDLRQSLVNYHLGRFAEPLLRHIEMDVAEFIQRYGPEQKES